MLTDLLFYQPTNQSLWQGRTDSLPNERYFQRVRTINLLQESLPKKPCATIIIGFCSDEGIRRNQGRIGASQGPDHLRQQLGKLACHHPQDYLDAGNILCPEGKLEHAQAELSQLVAYCHAQGYKTLILGGGHEIAWGHYNGLIQHHPQLGIINFDAHFDLRPIHAKQLGNSGTPFWQIAQYCHQNKQPFDYCCLGIQELANTASLFDNAHHYQVPYLTCEQMNENNLAWQYAFLDNFLQNKKALYLTVCLDVFNESFAPGVSAPQALGLFPWQAIPLLKYILQTGKVVSIDIAELSPPLDQEQKTARLAALLVAKMLACF